MKKKLFVQTYGCQMNVYDSSKMTDLMLQDSYEVTTVLDESDMVVLNTCHIREKASEKTYSELGRIKAIKERRRAEGRRYIIAVAGCVGQAEGEEVFRRAPYVDIVVGPQSYHNLPEYVKRVELNGERVLNLELSKLEKFDYLPEEVQKEHSAFLTIQEGCDKFCKFCCVPYTRGAEYSRKVEDIYHEAVRLVAGGSCEITLLGQNVSSYHGVDPKGSVVNLAKLLHIIAVIPGLQRLRYTTSHPGDMDDELIQAHATIPNLMRFLHLPVQSGSDAILKHMNRKHDANDYLEVIKKFRVACPDIGFSSDFIVGYPGETEQDFEDTLKLIEQVRYVQAYSYKYSPRPGTPASDIKEQVPENVKTERLRRLQALIIKQQLEFNQSFVGQTMKVLFERPGKLLGQLIGKSPYMQSVHAVVDDSAIGKILDVEIISAGQNSLAGKVI